MKTFCEIMSLYILPGIRALIARELIETHKLTQKEAARRLGMTQPAISQYKKYLRGNRVGTLNKDKEINEKISSISTLIANNEIDLDGIIEELCNVCEMIRKKYGSNLRGII